MVQSGQSGQDFTLIFRILRQTDPLLPVRTACIRRGGGDGEVLTDCVCTMPDITGS